jgi:N-formylglutamate amidohydrolase
MIEVNRKLYLDEANVLKKDNFGKIQKAIRDVLESLQKRFYPKCSSSCSSWHICPKRGE